MQPSRATKTPTVYRAIPWERGARATCYRCDHEMGAQQMIWTRGAAAPTYRALCPLCGRHPAGDDLMPVAAETVRQRAGEAAEPAH